MPEIIQTFKGLICPNLIFIMLKLDLNIFSDGFVIRRGFTNLLPINFDRS